MSKIQVGNSEPITIIAKCISKAATVIIAHGVMAFIPISKSKRMSLTYKTVGVEKKKHGMNGNLSDK